MIRKCFSGRNRDIKSIMDVMKVPRKARKGNFGSMLNRYPTTVGVGIFISEDKLTAIDNILALALTSTISIWFARKVLETENATLE